VVARPRDPLGISGAYAANEEWLVWHENYSSSSTSRMVSRQRWRRHSLSRTPTPLGFVTKKSTEDEGHAPRGSLAAIGRPVLRSVTRSLL
jgi:hypothetical protein